MPRFPASTSVERTRKRKERPAMVCLRELHPERSSGCYIDSWPIPSTQPPARRLGSRDVGERRLPAERIRMRCRWLLLALTALTLRMVPLAAEGRFLFVQPAAPRQGEALVVYLAHADAEHARATWRGRTYPLYSS